VVALTSLPLDDPDQAVSRALALAAVGVTGLVHGWRYADAREFADAAKILAEGVRPRVAARA
jgi:hypothetical protein